MSSSPLGFYPGFSDEAGGSLGSSFFAPREFLRLFLEVFSSSTDEGGIIRFIHWFGGTEELGWAEFCSSESGTGERSLETSLASSPGGG